MSWPLISDFSRILQNPKVAFRDPSLRECSIEVDNLGQPKPRSGNFATVYRGFRPDGREFAIRVFNRAADDRRERYQTISKYLGDRKLSSVVGFEYDEKGIRSASDGKLYPLVIMDWVPGVTLFEWCRDRSREGYQEALAIGADVWLQLVRELAAHHVVHGDLQHGNVLVSHDGYFKLVDYDGMGVPDLFGQRNIEIGLVPYQHPGRNWETNLFPGIDNFSALVIYVALRALAASPRLWLTYVDTPGYDKLLFRKEDFENPAQSYLYHELLQSPDNQVRDLTHYLFQLYRYELHDVPPIDEVLLWCNSIEDLLNARDWDTAVQLADRMGPGEQLAPHIAAQVSQAYQRVACRKTLEQAIERGDEDEIERRYIPELLDDYPAAAAAVEQARQARQVKEVLTILESCRRFRTWPKYKQTFLANQDLLANRKSAKSYREEMKRLLTADSVRKLLKDPNSDDQAVMEAWKYLQALGGHESAEGLKHEVEARLSRAQKLSQFEALVQQAPKKPAIKFDKKLVAAWNPAWTGTGPQFAALQSAYQGAQERLQKFTRISELSKQEGMASEQEIALLARDLPAEYHEKLHMRVEVAQARVEAFRRLKEAFQTPISDVAISEAWRLVVKARGQHLAPEKLQAQIETANKRTPRIRLLRALPQNLPPAEYDQKLLEIWEEELLADCHDAKPWQTRYTEAKARQAVLAQIEAAIAERDPKTIEQLRGHASLRGYSFSPEWKAKLASFDDQLAQSQNQRRQGLMNALLESERGQFLALYDTALVRDICEKSHHHQALVANWVDADLTQLSTIGLALGEGGGLKPVDEPAENGAEKKEGPLRLRATWQWPHEHMSNECRLAIIRQKPKAKVTIESLDPVYQTSLDRATYHQDPAGHEFDADPEWHDAYVTVWAVIDLGFQTFASEPLVVGQLKLKKAKTLWGLFG